MIWGKAKEMKNNVNIPKMGSNTHELSSHFDGETCGHHTETSTDLEGEEEFTSDTEGRETDHDHIGLRIF